MRVLFLQEQPEVLQRLQQPRDPNPGVGGTSYTTCQLAYELHVHASRQHLPLQIHLGALEPAPATFHGVPVLPVGERDPADAPPWDVVVATGGSLEALHSGRIRLRWRRLLAWVHHPYDHDKTRKARAMGAEVLSIGRAQYLSNLLVAGPHHHIDNLFCAERIRSAAGPDRPRTPGCLRVGYMGALIPSKGLHELAQQWPAIRQALTARGLDGRLEVIGGASLYNFRQGHPQLPCDRAYGDRLTALLGAELERSVTFHGTLGDSRYPLMASCDLAVVNPSGDGEAFPATILEWLSLGVPVLTSLNYGCADAMQLLPALSLRNAGELLPKLLALLELPAADAERLRLYCRQIGSDFSARQAAIISQWTLLLLQPQPGVLVNEYLPAQAYRRLLINYLRSQLRRLRQRLH